MENLLWETYRQRHCDKGNVPSIPMDFACFKEELLAAYPGSEKELKMALEKWVGRLVIEIQQADMLQV